MPRIEITGDYGDVKLGDTLLPGVYQGMSISGEVRIKEEEAEGQSSKYKQCLGYEDLSVTLTLILPNDEESTPHQKLQTIVALFRKTDQTAKPEVYRIVNRHTAAWSLDKALIKEMKSDDLPNVDYIRVTLTFIEWQSPLVKIEARAVQPPLMDRTNSTLSMDTDSALSMNMEEVESWQRRPSADTYKDTIEVPDDD